MRPALQVASVDVTEVASRYPDGLAILRSGGGMAGMIIRNVFPADTMEVVVRRVSAAETRIAANPSAYYPGRVFGRVLPAEPDASLTDYFREATVFPEESRTIFRGFETDFLTRLEEVLRAMSGGREVALARSADGHAYQAYSIREMLPGGEIGLHYENEAFDSPSMRELAAMCGPRPHVLSAYLALQVPEVGGELSLYGISEDDPEAARLKTMERQDEESFAHFEQLAPRQPLLAGTGDMLLFDAGRYFHRVTRVGGTRARWTMGAFIIQSQDGSSYRYFA